MEWHRAAATRKNKARPTLFRCREGSASLWEDYRREKSRRPRLVPGDKIGNDDFFGRH
jgi:hypothetical protein